MARQPTFLLTLALLAGCEALDRGAGPVPPGPPPVIPAQGREAADPEPRLDVARQELQRGNYDDALSMFQAILAENPTIAPAYIGVGDVRMEQQRYDLAEPAYARAVRLEPRNFDAQYGHGRALLMLDRFVEAVRSFHRALTIEPDSIPANLSLATTYLRMDEPSSAVVFAERAVQLDPGNGSAQANLGAAYESLGRHAEAIEHYLVAIELLDEPAPVMLNLVNSLAQERRYQETVNAAENLIRVAPSANAYERLGWARFKLGLYGESRGAYLSAVRLDPQHWPSYNGIGVNALNTWLLSGKTDVDARIEARDAFRQSLRANRDQPEVIRLMSHYDLR